MGVFGAHQGKSGFGSTSLLVQNSLMAIAGIAAFWISLRYVIPNDLFTSALFFDALGLQPVFNTPAAAFADGGFWAEMPNVTTEAFIFSLSLLIIQILVGYTASTAGGYTNSSRNIVSLLVNVLAGKEKVGRNSLNWAKVGWVSFYWTIALFDTFTDTAYRAGSEGSADFVLVAFVVSFFYYSMASEWMIIVGAKTGADYTIRTFGGIKSAVSGMNFGSQMAPRQMPGGNPRPQQMPGGNPRSNPQSHPQRQPKQQQNKRKR